MSDAEIRFTSANKHRLNQAINNWDKNSATRTSNRDYGPMSLDMEFNFYKPELVPLLFHPIFANASERTKKILQILQLSRYLYSTEILETYIVNPALIALQTLDFISQEVKTSAWKIYTDEAYHSLMVAELREEIHKHTGIALPQLPFPSAQKLILNEVNQLPINLKPIGLICVASVSETLITPNLVQAMDNTLFPFIKQMFINHAQDEAVHSLFFTDIFIKIWNNISYAEKDSLYHLIPIAIKNFLGLDVQSLKYDVEQFSLNGVSSEEIAREAITYYLTNFQPSKNSVNSTFKMLINSNFLNECQFDTLFDGVDVPKLFDKYIGNANIYKTKASI